MMNLIKLFKENYQTIDRNMNQGIDDLKSGFNSELEHDIFLLLCKKISNPIANHFNNSLGDVYFVNDIDADIIMFKFRNINIIYDTSESLENIINDIKNEHMKVYV